VTAAPPRYTVVIITRDRRRELEHTLDRMTALPGAPPVIVVDNASGDGSAAAAERYAGVQVIRAPANLGAVGRNLAVERVTTPYVAFCDDDIWWEPEAPGRAAALLDAHPELASVTGLILVEPGGREDPITPELRHSPVPAPAWLPGPALLSILAGASMLRVSAFRAAASRPGCGWAARRSCWRWTSPRPAGGCAGTRTSSCTMRRQWPATRRSAACWASGTHCGRPGCAARSRARPGTRSPS
jgi:glycosyltransferase involved in cell wall biosynthesis